MQCEYCKKDFSNKGNLTLHQKTAKYCLKLRDDEFKNSIKCDFCNNVFNRKSHLAKHLESCKAKDLFNFNQKILEIEVQYEKKIKELKSSYESQISKLENNNLMLQDQIKELATKAIEKPTNTNTFENYNNNNSTIKTIDQKIFNMVPMNITHESILQKLEENFTENHFMKGQKGVAEFCLENILITPDKKYLMKCTDPSRKVFVHIDENGNVHKDINADRLTKSIFEPVIHVTKKIWQDMNQRYLTNYNPEEDEDEEKKTQVDEERISYAGDKLCEIKRLKTDNGEFVRGILPTLTQ